MKENPNQIDLAAKKFIKSFQGLKIIASLEDLTSLLENNVSLDIFLKNLTDYNIIYGHKGMENQLKTSLVSLEESFEKLRKGLQKIADKKPTERVSKKFTDSANSLANSISSVKSSLQIDSNSSKSNLTPMKNN